MGISVIAFVFLVVAVCLCKWGPERWAPSVFMVITGLMVASTGWGQQVSAFVVDMVNSLFAGMA